MGKMSFWIKTSDRVPTADDAGYNEEVIAIYRDSETEVMGGDYWAYVARFPEQFIYWMPTPELPVDV